MNTHLLEDKLNTLPDDLKKEAMDFIDFLLTKKKHGKNVNQFTFTWEGGLSDLKDTCTSVDLQHQSMEWR